MFSPRERRAATVSAEAVLLLGIAVPAAVTLLYLGASGCAGLFALVLRLVGGPHL